MGDYLNNHKIMSYIIGAMSETGKEIKEEKKPSAVTYTGKITRVGRDRNGLYYLFRKIVILDTHSRFHNNIFNYGKEVVDNALCLNA